jgi:hypothetical protein
LTDPEITRVVTGYIVLRGDKKIGGPFNSWRAALEWIDSQRSKRDRAAAAGLPRADESPLGSPNSLFRAGYYTGILNMRLGCSLAT